MQRLRRPLITRFNSSKSSLEHGSDDKTTSNQVPERPTHNKKDVERRWRTWYRKVGALAITFIIGGTIGTLGIMGFWAFLWFSNDHNSTWHSIVARDQIKVILTITAEISNKLVAYMLGVECSMLIALALERAQVLFPGLPSASFERGGHGGGKSFSLVKKVFTGKLPTNGWRINIQAIICALVLIEAFTSGVHTILLADITVGYVPSFPSIDNVNFGFSFQPQTYANWTNTRNILYRDTTWDRKAPFYPAFAEYTEDPVEQEGTSDTGVTLRAFLPIADSTSRVGLSTYMGQTTVLDARVTCQVPVFEGLVATVQGSEGNILFGGWVRPNRTTPRLGNFTKVSIDSSKWVYNSSIPFICAAALRDSEDFDTGNQWRTALCQLIDSYAEGGIAGGIVSEFKDYNTWIADASNLNASQNFGTAYLIFNVSSGIEYIWTELYSNRTAVPTPINGGTPINEWLSFELDEGLSFSSTLCYSAFDTADIPVNISSAQGRNRTEPEPKFDSTFPKYTFEEIRKQYGQPPINGTYFSLEERGLFLLSARTWIARPGVQLPVEPYLRQFVNLGGPDGYGNGPGWSAILWNALTASGPNVGTAVTNPYISTFFNTSQFQVPEQYTELGIRSPDPMHSWLFQEIVSTGGSVAFALQSLITLLSSMAYYDQIGQFDNSGKVSQSYFVATNLPKQYWGWLTVVIVLCIHIVLSWYVLYLFLTETKYTILGESWQQLAHAVTDETKAYIELARDKTNDEVKAWMSSQRRKTRVKLGPYGADGELGIYEIEDGDRSLAVLPDLEVLLKNPELTTSEPDPALVETVKAKV